MTYRILVIDDEPNWIAYGKTDLSRLECTIVVASSMDDAILELDERQFDLVIASTRYLSVLGVIGKWYTDVRVIVMTVQPTTQEAIKAYRLGALRYSPKSFGDADLLNQVLEVLPQAKSARENTRIRKTGCTMMQEQKSILVVHDVRDWQITLHDMLIDNGFQVQVADSREEALRLFAASKSDLAVIDIRLDETAADDMSGVMLARELKALGPTVSIILIAGYETLQTIDAASAFDSSGQRVIDDFIVKTETEDLVSRVFDLLAQHGGVGT